MPDNYTVGVAHSLFNAYNGHDNQEFLLFVCAVEDLSLKAVNFKSLQYFKKLFPFSSEKVCFFQEVIHEEDFPMLQHLFDDNCDSMREDREMTLRVRSPFGYWKNFLFTCRSYTGFESDEEHILVFARPVETAKFTSRKGINIDTEKSLQESLNRYRILVNSLDQGFGVMEMIFDLEKNPIDFLFVEVNPAFEGHTGLNHPLGKTMKEFFLHHEGHWFRRFGNVAFTGEAIRFEDYSSERDRWFEVYAFPFGNKRSRKVACLFSNITPRKEAEEKLRKLNEDLELKVRSRTYELEENNELLQMVFDTVNQGIFLMKPLFGENYDIVDFTYVRVNKVVNRYYSINHMVGRSFLRLNPEACEKGVFENFKQTMLTGESHDFEVLFEEDGKKNWFRVTSRRKRGLLVNSFENITRLKKRSHELRDNIRFKKQLIETSPDIIMIFNLYDEKIRYINRDLDTEQEMTTENVEGMDLLTFYP